MCKRQIHSSKEIRDVSCQLKLQKIERTMHKDGSAAHVLNLEKHFIGVELPRKRRL